MIKMYHDAYYNFKNCTSVTMKKTKIEEFIAGAKSKLFYMAACMTQFVLCMWGKNKYLLWSCSCGMLVHKRQKNPNH